MAETDDKAGRPIVVVTGMGIVTSLGTGVEDNWRKLTAGESGIRPIGRFATEGAVKSGDVSPAAAGFVAVTGWKLEWRKVPSPVP